MIVNLVLGAVCNVYFIGYFWLILFIFFYFFVEDYDTDLKNLYGISYGNSSVNNIRLFTNIYNIAVCFTIVILLM